jgi:hypothetical protein
LGFTFPGSRLEYTGVGSTVYNLGCRVQGSEPRVKGCQFRVGVEVKSEGFRVYVWFAYRFKSVRG